MRACIALAREQLTRGLNRAQQVLQILQAIVNGRLPTRDHETRPRRGDLANLLDLAVAEIGRRHKRLPHEGGGRAIIYRLAQFFKIAWRWRGGTINEKKKRLWSARHRNRNKT